MRVNAPKGRKALPMESYADLREEDLQVLAAQILLRRIAHPLQCLTTCGARLRIDASKRQVVISWLEVVLLLFSQLLR